MSDFGRNHSQRSWWLWRGPALVWLVLLASLATSIGLAYLPLGNGNIEANLLIAAVMIALLFIFLMDLKSAKALLRVVAASGLLWLILMFTLTFSDYLSRYY
jgi:caa(3)-type oxidase subunit IV